ncbi:hypothetical protein ACLPHM_00895 [Paenalcaligenes sp. Me131]|uniref:hypothetical protein n=1 Tax=Paenalcaligenes sp. Me131 TaxID=3392636 RepID=UPI003D2AA146
MPISSLLAVPTTVLDHNRLDAASLTQPERASGGDLSASAVQPIGESVRISISAEALNAAAKHQKSEKNKNADIDESDLPDTVKGLLKRIRELREQLEQKQLELQQVTADQKLSDSEKAQKVSRLQGEVAALSGAVVTAMQDLDELMNSQNISADQKKTAGFLLMK